MSNQTDLRTILARAISEIEAKFEIHFSDKEWEVINRLETEIHEWERNLEVKMPPREEIRIWDAFTDNQRRLLDAAQNKFGISVLDAEQDRMLQARDLESGGYITITRRYESDKFVICKLTDSGKKLLDFNKGISRT